jgi:hypothetical protein
VHAEQRRDHVEHLEAVELILAQELAVSQHRPRRLGSGEARLRSAVGGDQQVGGALAVALRDDFYPFLGGPSHRSHHFIRGGWGVARVARRVFADRLVMRPVAPGGQALRTAVDGELCAGDAHPLHVGAAHAGLDELAIDEDVGIDRHIGSIC